MSIRVFLAIVGVTLGAVAPAQAPLPPAPPAEVGLDALVLAEATALLRQYVADGRIAGAVAAVARHGKVGYLEAVGVQDLQTRAPMTPRTLFRIYSMTKPITAVAVMQLHEQGKFQLTDPVSKYLPEFAAVRVEAGEAVAPRAPARPITVEDLLLHTSGLSHRTSDLYRRLQVRSRADTLPVFVRKVTQAPLMEDPHTRFRYSEATTVLGRLVEVWSGQPFDTYLARHVLQPLGMSDTGFVVRPADRPRLATVYAPSPTGLQPIELETPPVTEPAALIEGAVGLASTVPDFLRFAQMLAAGGELGGTRVLPRATVARMVANGLPEDVQRARGGAHGWGLANVNVLLEDATGPFPGRKGEYGWDGTAGTIFWVDPSRDLVVVLMTQSSPANPDGLRQRFKQVVERAVRP